MKELENKVFTFRASGKLQNWLDSLGSNRSEVIREALREFIHSNEYNIEHYSYKNITVEPDKSDNQVKEVEGIKQTKKDMQRDRPAKWNFPKD